MGYLNEFHKRIEGKNLMAFLQLWEEYCTCDEVDGLELKKILDMIYHSEYCDQFGNYAESILPLWKSIEEGAELADSIFERILDIQTTNSPLLAELACHFLLSRYSQEDQFSEKLRLVGLRSKQHFRRAIRNYKLLSHLKAGSFVYHTAGWGTGEVASISFIRQELSIEFENVLGKKELSFENAFKTLEPLPKDHFLALRFGDADSLEKMAKKDPVQVIRKLLTDLGPKTAFEIKEEMSELVIPKSEWSTWWQLARAKLKKAASIEAPKTLSAPFRIREQEVSPKERFALALQMSKSVDEKILSCYSFIRDYSEQLRQQEALSLLESTLEELLHSSSLNEGQRFELLCLGLETSQRNSYREQLEQLVETIDEPSPWLAQISIVALQKKMLIHLRATKSLWASIFARLLPQVDQTLLRDYLFKELLLNAPTTLEQRLEALLQAPHEVPEFLHWYLQKILQDQKIPPRPREGQGARDGLWRVAEAFLTALHRVEELPASAPLAKKMASFLTARRYEVFRQIIEGGTTLFLQELLLIASKCQSFSAHDNKIFASLGIVACPELQAILGSEENTSPERVIWTTAAGLDKIKDRIKHLSNVEMLANSREVEKARAHGDLKENYEYKAALEQRARIQAELRALSRQLECAQVISPTDLDTSRVSVGTRIYLFSQDQKKVHYTILGPWDADVEKNVISFQSKLASSLLNKTVGDKINIQGISCTISSIESAI